MSAADSMPKITKDVLIDSFTAGELRTLAACMLSASGACLLMYMSSGRLLLYVFYILTIISIIFAIWMYVCVSDTSKRDFVNRIKSTVNIIRSARSSNTSTGGSAPDKMFNIGNIFANGRQ